MMVQQLKEDQAGKSEEELSECFRIFDKYERQTPRCFPGVQTCPLVLWINEKPINYIRIKKELNNILILSTTEL